MELSRFTQSMNAYQDNGLEGYLRRFNEQEDVQFAEEMERSRLRWLTVADFMLELSTDENMQVRDLINAVAARIVERARAHACASQ